MSTSLSRSNRFSGMLCWVAPALVLGMCTLPVMAQNQPGGGGRPDPAQMRQMMIDRMKEALGASDEEMQALAPKLEKVMTLQREAGGGGMRGMFGRGGPQGGDQPALSPTQQKAKDLKDAVDANAPAADIKAKMQALRDARAAAKQDLTKAQAELKELLTQKQEATLLMFGMLE